MKLEKFLLIETERENGVSIKKSKNFDDELAKKLSVEALPFGSPASDVIKCITLSDVHYITYVKMNETKDQGYALVFPLENTESNPLGFVESMGKNLSSILEEPETIEDIEIELEYSEPNVGYEKYNHFSKILFALLTKQPIILVGEMDEIKNFVASIYEILPNQYWNEISVSILSSSLTENVTIFSLPMSEETMELLDQVSSEYNILFIPQKEGYGFYSSPFVEKISQMYTKGQTDQIKDELRCFIEKAYESNQIGEPLKIAQEEKMPMADVQLLLWIRAKHHEIEFERGILENM